MKKILAILLSTAMLVAMFAVMALPSSAAAQAFGGKFDMADDTDGASAFIYTTGTDMVGAWWARASFKPAETAGDWEVVAMNSPDGTDAGAAALEAPANGFVWAIHYSCTISGARNFLIGLNAGDIVTITGLDLTNKTVAADATIAVKSVAPDYDLEGNVAYQKPYTTTDPYRMGGADVQWGYDATKDPTYPDNGGELTDGALPKAKSYLDAAWVGLHDGTPDAAEAGFAWVKIDLEGTYTLNKVVAYVAPNLGDGVTTPAWMGLVGYKADGTAFDIGEFTIPAAASDNDAYIAVPMDLSDVVVDAIEVRMTRSGFTFISEVAAYGVAGGEYADDNSSNEDTSNEDTSNEDTSNEDTSNEDTSNEDTSNEDTSNEDTSNEDTSNEDTSNEDTSNEDNTSDEDEITIEDLMGPVNEDAGFTVDIVAPETYVAGETFSIDVVIKDIANADGFDTFELTLEYDQDVLELAETLNGSAISVFNGFAEWEDLTIVNEDGTIAISAGTAGGDTGTQFTYAKNDGEISFTIDFTAKADATADALIYVCNECPMGYYTDGGVEAQGNGDYAVIKAGVPATEDAPATEDEPVKPGDATSMIFFAIIALVAIAGSAVVIKTRR